MDRLEQLREKIDTIDEQITNLLNDRADLVLGIKEAKQQSNIDIYSPAREQQILDKVRRLAKGGNFPTASLEQIFRAIISATRSLIGELKIAFVGPLYSLGHTAAVYQLGSAVSLVPQDNAGSVIAAVSSGEAHYGVLPAETTSSGVILDTFEHLLKSSLSIVAEVLVSERYALSAKEGSLSTVKRVYAAPNSFHQCWQWLEINLPSAERVVVANGALAIERTRSDKEGAAITLESMGDETSLNIIATNISSTSGWARHLVVGHRIPIRSGNDKTSLVCSVRERAGVLREMLRPFADRGITLLRIESQTLRQGDCDYAFFLECAGHISDQPVSEAVEALNALCESVRVLGSYPAAAESRLRGGVAIRPDKA